jgi:hypothetical protein
VVNAANGECTATGSACVVVDGGTSCEVCGAIGQPCCNNVTCNSTAAVCTGAAGTGRVCEGCGGVGEQCCAGNLCTASGSVCGNAVMGVRSCATCGGPGQPCCVGQNDAGNNIRVCDSGRACVGGGVGTCPNVADASAD